MANVYRNLGAVVKDTGGVWDQLDAQMSAQAASPSAEGGMGGIWGMIVPDNVGGVWDEFDNETVYLRRDSVQRDDRIDVWSEATDETLILPKEGLLAVWDAVLARTNAEGGVDLDGTLMLMAEDVRNIWHESAEETLIMQAPTASIFAQQVRQRDLTSFRPRRVEGYALKRLTDARGETYWILKNLRTDAYLRLTREQLFLWDQMDGKASVQDIAVAYMLEYGKLAITGLIMLLDQLQQKGFIEPLVDIYGAADQSVAERRARVWWRRLLRGFFNSEFAIGGIDGVITRSYTRGGRLLFAPVVQWLMLAVIVAGGGAFLGLALGYIDRDVSVLGGGGLGAILALVSLYLLQAVTLLIHEWAHAVATKHYGREVRRGGFVIYMGMPAAFVDTTDIWMEPRRPRIVVSWAGPHSGFFLGGLASLILLAGASGVVGSVLYQFALLTYFTSFMNLNPLLKLDGYYILMDWLEIPRLREKSLAFIGGPLRTRLRERAPFSRDERIFAVFGVLSGAWTIIALVMLIATLGGYLLSLAQTLPGLIIIGLIVTFFAWRWVQRRLRRYLIARRKRASAAG